MSASGLPALPILRAGFEGSGSPRWLMRCIQRNGLDRAHGFRLDLGLLGEDGRRHGTLHAVADGRADIADADWLALAAARADGLPVTAVHPYGRILGTLMASRGFVGDGLHALAGRRLGVLSTTDKNWTILRAACAAQAGFDLAQAVRVQRCTSRGELVAALAAGTVDAALVHWHLVPDLAATHGCRVLAEVPALAGALGAAPAATTFFVVHEALANNRPQLVDDFLAATRAAIVRLRDDGSEWAAVIAETSGAAGPCQHAAEATDTGTFHATPLTAGASAAESTGAGTAPALATLHHRWRERIADLPSWGPDSRRALDALRACLGPGPQGAAVASLVPAGLPAGTFHPRFLP